MILFQILHQDELNLPFEGDTVFESLEDDPEVNLNPIDIRETYQAVVSEMIEGYRKNLPSLGVEYVFMETSTPLDQALNYYLLRRKSLHKP